MVDNCNIYNIHNCSGGCYLCNITETPIDNFGLLVLCKTTDYCIKKGTYCDESIYIDKCFITNHVFRTFIVLINLIVFSLSFRKIIYTLEVYQYDKFKQGIFLTFYSAVNLAIPSILLFTNNLFYVIYFIVCILSYLYVFTCFPKLNKKEYFVNKNYNIYNLLSDTLSITPIQSRTNTPFSDIISTHDEVVHPENNSPLPTIQSHT